MGGNLAAVLTQTGRIQVEEQAVAGPGPGAEVLLAVESVGLCGTDLHLFDGTYPAALPLTPGHEISATVVEAGGDPRLQERVRVMVAPVIPCRACVACVRGAWNTCSRMAAIGVHRPGGLQRLLRVPAENCFPVGDLDPEATALVETLSVCHRAVQRAHIAPGETVIVLGAGPIGLGTVIAATDAGARVLVLDRLQNRLDLAMRVGASAVATDLATLSERALELTDGAGATVVVEASGSPALAAAAFDLVAVSGTIVMVGVCDHRVEIPMRDFTRKEISVLGSRSSTDFPGAIALVERRRDDVVSLVSHRFALEDAPEAFRVAIEEPESAVKVMVRP
jgi:L-gulonate 5-dehydrogenase